MSKLSRLALISPYLSKQKLNIHGTLISNIIWGNKPAKDHGQLYKRARGLGVTDKTTLWQTLTFSWIRSPKHAQLGVPHSEIQVELD